MTVPDSPAYLKFTHCCPDHCVDDLCVHFDIGLCGAERCSEIDDDDTYGLDEWDES